MKKIVARILAVDFIAPVSIYCGLAIFAPIKEQHALENIKADTLLSLLGFIVLVGGAASYIFQEIIRKDLQRAIDEQLRAAEELNAKNQAIVDARIKQYDERIKHLAHDIEQLAKEERLASSVETDFAMALALWHVHHEDTKVDAGRATNDGPLLDIAIQMLANSGEDAEKLPIEKHGPLIHKFKNNLAFFLAVRGAPADSTMAHDIAKELFDISTKDEYKRRHVWRITWALVLLRFLENNPDCKTEAVAILRDIQKIIPKTEWGKFRQSLIERWRYIEADKKTKSLSAALQEAGLT